MNLVYLAEHYGLTEVAKFWEEVVNINRWNQSRISKIVVEKLFGSIAQKKIVILGFAFKANTNDTRESAAIQICKDLINEGAELIIHDPKVNPLQIQNDLQIEPLSKRNLEKIILKNNKTGNWRLSKNLDIFENAQAVLVLTEWDEYKNIKWENVIKKMVKPAWVFDSRSIVNIELVKKAGFHLWRLGDGTQKD